MKAKLLKLLVAVVALLNQYPKALSLVVTLAVALVAKLGFHVTPDQFVAVAGVLYAATLGFLHAVTVPKVNLKGK